MRYFGIIGYPLGHSFSPAYFNSKFQTLGIQAEYLTYPIDHLDAFPELIKLKEFSGMNVTIPYKESIIPYLDALDISASEVGAVNTIKFDAGKTTGYNTDIWGFEQSLTNWIPDVKTISGALVLGSGGASKAVVYVLQRLRIPYLVIGRKAGKNVDLIYAELTHDILEKHNLIINTTPLGMYPLTQTKPDIPYEFINEKYFLYDLVYNPEKSLFLGVGLEKGCTIKNGIEMLNLQAEFAWKIWNTIEI